LAYAARMRFFETPIFTRVVTELLEDEEYHSLQVALLLQPRAGRVIRGSGGLRKLRWSSRGQGKNEASATFYLLYAFRKNVQEDLTALQLRTLSRLVREEFS
jgi:hypothetical protein